MVYEYILSFLCSVYSLVVGVGGVVLTLTRIIKSAVTRQAPVTAEGWRNTPREKTQTKPKVVHAYIIADATINNASARKQKNGIGSQPTTCQVHINW